MAEDNQVLPAAAGAGGMNPQLAAFLQMLMGGGASGGLHSLLSGLFGGGGGGGPGGLPFGGAGQGFGHFLMNNPGLLHGLGLIPHGAGLTGGWPMAGGPTGTAAAPDPAAPPAATPTAGTAGGSQVSDQGGAPTEPTATPGGLSPSPFRPGGPLLGLTQGSGAEKLWPMAGGPTGIANPNPPALPGLPPMLRKG